MGTRGQIPKRSEQRMRRNKEGSDGLKVETIEMEGEVKPPPAWFESEMMRDLWSSIIDSGQAKWYEPSDWMYLKMTLQMFDHYFVENKVPGAMLLSALDGMLSKLLITEGDRRRVKLEVQRTEAEGKLIDAAGYFEKVFNHQAKQA